MICVLIAAVCILIQVVELEEEIGWREYLLPKQIAEYGVGKGTLLNGLYWGIAHLPLIYLGFNYSPENAGALWSNMLIRTQSDRANQYVGTDTMCNYHTEKFSTLLSEMQARKFD